MIFSKDIATVLILEYGYITAVLHGLKRLLHVSAGQQLGIMRLDDRNES